MAPISLPDRLNSSKIRLTTIGDFGVQRKARPEIPAHLHTGVDIKRPSNNYIHEPIYPFADGIIISKRTDGPYAQLIIEHHLSEDTFWTLYEHIAEILVDVNQPVGPEDEIARFFNETELNTHGWQFDHFHFEVLRTPPIPIKPSINTPTRLFKSQTLECFTVDQLLKHFHDPLIFIQNSEK